MATLTAWLTPTVSPSAASNYGIDAARKTTVSGGKTVDTVEDDVIPSYDDAATGDVVAVFFNPTDYAENSNGSFSTVKVD